MEMGTAAPFSRAPGASAAVALGEEQPARDQGDEAVEDRPDEGREKSRDEESFDDLGRQPEEARVDDEEEKPEREDRDRQREEDEERPDDGIDEAQHQGGGERGDE